LYRKPFPDVQKHPSAALPSSTLSAFDVIVSQYVPQFLIHIAFVLVYFYVMLTDSGGKWWRCMWTNCEYLCSVWSKPRTDISQWTTGNQTLTCRQFPAYNDFLVYAW